MAIINKLFSKSIILIYTDYLMTILLKYLISVSSDFNKVLPYALFIINLYIILSTPYYLIDRRIGNCKLNIGIFYVLTKNITYKKNKKDNLNLSHFNLLYFYI